MVFRNLRERFGIDDQDYQVRGVWPALRIWKRGSGLGGWTKGLPGSGPSLPGAGSWRVGRQRAGGSCFISVQHPQSRLKKLLLRSLT